MGKFVPLLIAISIMACTGRQATRVESGTVYDISREILENAPNTTINLGKMRSGEVVQYDAWLRNTDDRPVVVIGVESSCGCTSVEYERNPIAPGGKGGLSFRFDSRGLQGKQLKVLEIRTSATQKRYKLLISADVE